MYVLNISLIHLNPSLFSAFRYSEVPNRRADRNKRAGLEKKFSRSLSPEISMLRRS